MKAPQVTIVIPNWNGKKLLRICLGSIKKNTIYPNFKTAVVDNGSQDGSVEIVKREFPNVQLICNKENAGFSKACNQGIKLALKDNSDYVLLLNNDIEISRKNWLKELIGTAESDSKVGIIGCKLLFPDGSPQPTAGWIKPLEWSWIGTDNTKTIEVDVVSGASVLIKRKVIEKIGLLDEGFSPYLYEEFDYYIRTKKAGYKIIYNPEITLIHHGRATLIREEEDLILFIYERNRIRLALLNFPLPWLITEFSYLILSTFFRKKDPKIRLALTNIRPRRDFLRRISFFIKAWQVNLRNLSEIREKRKNRTAKIWC